MAAAINEMTAAEKIEIMKEELRCSICQDFFVTACTLNCSHSFCYACIYKWKQNHLKCPLCRCFIKSMAPSLALDNMVATLKNLSETVPEENVDVSLLGLEHRDSSLNSDEISDFLNSDEIRDILNTSSESEFFDVTSFSLSSHSSADVYRREHYSDSATVGSSTVGEGLSDLESTTDESTVDQMVVEANRELYSQQSDVESINRDTSLGNSNNYGYCDENYHFEHSPVEVLSSDDHYSVSSIDDNTDYNYDDVDSDVEFL